MGCSAATWLRGRGENGPWLQAEHGSAGANWQPRTARGQLQNLHARSPARLGSRPARALAGKRRCCVHDAGGDEDDHHADDEPKSEAGKQFRLLNCGSSKL